MLLGLDELLPSFVLLDKIPLDPKMLGMSSGKVLVPGKVLQAFFCLIPNHGKREGNFPFSDYPATLGMFHPCFQPGAQRLGFGIAQNHGKVGKPMAGTKRNL